jgi:hypothetical protein
MAKDYIPESDAEIIEFANNFFNKTKGNEAGFSLNVSDTDELKTLLDAFVASYNKNNADQITARASRELKDTDKKPLEKKLRSMAQVVQTAPATTDEQRADLSLNVKDTTSSAVGVPTTRPVAEVDTSQPLRHTVVFYDNELDGKGKPEGVKGAEIFVKIGGEATMNEDDYRYLGTDTASPYLAVHKAENVGKQAHYLLRWVNTKNESGAWSNPVSATITG